MRLWQLDGGHDKLATNNAVELYNLANDIGERENFANADTAKRDELLANLLAWFKSTDALLASEPNPKYDPNGKYESIPAATKKGKQAPATGKKLMPAPKK